MEDTRLQARATARQFVVLARAGELDTVIGSVGMLSYTAWRPGERLPRILTALLEAIASMTLGRVDRSEADIGFVAGVRRNGLPMDIDDLEPPVRATVRALLALINEHPEDASDQVTLALAGGRQASIDVIVLALLWTISALDVCERDGQPVPAWLSRIAPSAR
jgi:hypothetical protein